MSKSLVDLSREGYGTNGGATLDDIRTGCMQRIAAAVESQADSAKAMASNYQKLQADRDMYKRWYENQKELKEAADRRINSLRGVITKREKLIKVLYDKIEMAGQGKAGDPGSEAGESGTGSEGAAQEDQ